MVLGVETLRNELWGGHRPRMDSCRRWCQSQSMSRVGWAAVHIGLVLVILALVAAQCAHATLHTITCAATPPSIYAGCETGCVWNAVPQPANGLPLEVWASDTSVAPPTCPHCKLQMVVFEWSDGVLWHWCPWQAGRCDGVPMQQGMVCP